MRPPMKPLDKTSGSRPSASQTKPHAEAPRHTDSGPVARNPIGNLGKFAHKPKGGKK